MLQHCIASVWHTKSMDTQFPRGTADLVGITVDTPPANRRLSKKSVFFFPLLSDQSKAWMEAYFVTSKTVFILEPQFGKVLFVITDVDELSVAEAVKEGLKKALL
jgi:peroxiredoxin